MAKKKKKNTKKAAKATKKSAKKATKKAAKKAKPAKKATKKSAPKKAAKKSAKPPKAKAPVETNPYGHAQTGHEEETQHDYEPMPHHGAGPGSESIEEHFEETEIDNFDDDIEGDEDEESDDEGYF